MRPATRADKVRSHPVHPPARFVAALVLAAMLSALPACGRRMPTVSETRVLFDTGVRIDAYGEDEAAVRSAVEDAFRAMEKVDETLNPYDQDSPIARFNRDPRREQTLPPEAVEVFSAIRRLDVSPYFSPTLFGVTKLYDFGGKQRVPTEDELMVVVVQSWTLGSHRAFLLKGDTAGFLTVTVTPTPPGLPPPGLDFGGAAKGLGVQRGIDALKASGKVSAALISAGSTTAVYRRKPDGSRWRIGVEDPRVPGDVVAAFEGGGSLRTVSTSGDYQQYFIKRGIRYHHILDPANGRPARGLRSLTVAGVDSALDSDILSTALFVMGPAKAVAYAKAHGFALYAVDARGRVLVVEPKDAGCRLRRVKSPKR